MTFVDGTRITENVKMLPNGVHRCPKR